MTLFSIGFWDIKGETNDLTGWIHPSISYLFFFLFLSLSFSYVHTYSIFFHHSARMHLPPLPSFFLRHLLSSRARRGCCLLTHRGLNLGSAPSSRQQRPRLGHALAVAAAGCISPKHSPAGASPSAQGLGRSSLPRQVDSMKQTSLLFSATRFCLWRATSPWAVSRSSHLGRREIFGDRFTPCLGRIFRSKMSLLQVASQPNNPCSKAITSHFVPCSPPPPHTHTPKIALCYKVELDATRKNHFYQKCFYNWF